jgi:hypothetical protein
MAPAVRLPHFIGPKRKPGVVRRATQGSVVILEKAKQFH